MMTDVKERNDSYKVVWGDHIKHIFGRLRMKCEYDAQLELRGLDYEDVNWIYLALVSNSGLWC
jgi:hypothetical protein